MKPSEVQGYLAEKLVTIGLREHADTFGQNIPASLANLTYAFEPGAADISSSNQTVSLFRLPITLSIYFKDYRNHTDLRTTAFRKMEEIFGLLLTGERSLGKGGFSIQPSGMQIDALSEKNQACAIMRLQFNVSMYLQLRGNF